MIERSEIGTYKVYIDRDGTFCLNIYNFGTTHVSTTRKSKETFRCSECNKILTQKDLKEIMFDNKL